MNQSCIYLENVSGTLYKCTSPSPSAQRQRENNKLLTDEEVFIPDPQTKRSYCANSHICTSCPYYISPAERERFIPEGPLDFAW